MPPVTPANTISTLSASPVLVEIRRGAVIECWHRGVVAVVDVDGRIVAQTGDVERAIFARSSIKPLQALPLVETGAADASGAEPVDLALACASHGGEPQHVERILAWLTRLGLSAQDLECGVHPPYHAPSAAALIRAGQAPTTLHHDCAGKHTGVIATCRHLGEPTRGYIEPTHPAQRRILRALEEMCGLDLADAPRGRDGCGFPQIAIKVRALAHAVARLGCPDALPPLRAASCRRLAAAMMAHPVMVSWSNNFVAQVSAIAHAKVLLKSGADGVFVAAIPAKGLGIALKIEDGAGIAREVAMAALIARHAGLDEEERAAMAALIERPLNNDAGKIVGAIAPAPNW